MDFETLKDWAKTSWEKQGAWRKQAEEDFAFRDGHQWSDSEKIDVQDASRIPIVFNRTAVILSSVAGTEINNRTEVRFIPREIGDVKPNEVLTAGGEWFRDQADAEDSESEAFSDLLVTGIGATETTLDFDADPEGEPEVLHRDVLKVFWDHRVTDKGVMSGRYRGIVDEMSKMDAEERFPDKDLSEIDASWIDGSGGEDDDHHVAGDNYEEGDSKESETGVIKVVRIQYRKRIQRYEVVDTASGNRVEMDQERFDMANAMWPNLPYRQITKWEWTEAVLGRRGIIDESQPDPDGPTIHILTGMYDRKEKMFYGLLRAMKDPQKFANKWLSQTLHIIGSNAKGGVMAEAGAVNDAADFEESWAAADGVTWLKDGALASGRVAPKPAAQMPAALMSLTEFAVSAIRDTSGVNLELLGLRDANQPGVLEYQRRQSAMTTLARFFDALRFYRKQQGQTVLHFLRNHIAPTGRLVRIVREDQAQYVPLAMDDDTQKYDTIVDDAPSAPNEKEKAWSVIEKMMPILQNAGLSMEDWADVLEYSPLPSSFAEKVRAKAAQQKQNPEAQQAQMLEAAKVESEIVENQASAGLDRAKTAEIQQQTQLAPIETMIDAQQSQQPLGIA